MSEPYLRLESAPGLRHPGDPYCDACDVETSLEDGEWMCESCGTTWPAEAMEADPMEATMYPDWSGEQLSGPVCPNGEAWRFSHLPPNERDEQIAAHLAEQEATR